MSEWNCMVDTVNNVMKLERQFLFLESNKKSNAGALKTDAAVPEKQFIFYLALEPSFISRSLRIISD